MLLAAVLLVGCDGRPAPRLASSTVQPAAPNARPLVEAAKPVAIDEASELLDFHLAWPAEVSAIPALAELIRAPATTLKAELLKTASVDKAQRAKQDFPFNRYEFSERYEVAGGTPRLLSLAAHWSEYTGGAHPMHGTKALLWDRESDRKVGFSDLLKDGGASLDPLIRTRFCKELDDARSKKRGTEAAPAVAPHDPFNQCPAFRELVLIPQGRPGGPLTTILVHADPYVAGPYAEGDYDILLPVAAEFVAELKPAYRASFEAQRQ